VWRVTEDPQRTLINLIIPNKTIEGNLLIGYNQNIRYSESKKEVRIMLTQLRGRSQITIPKNIIDTLGLKENDNLNIEVENGKIIINPVVVIPKDQAWFWADEWQLSEKEVDEEVKSGKIKTANSIDELMKDLKDEN